MQSPAPLPVVAPEGRGCLAAVARRLVRTGRALARELRSPRSWARPRERPRRGQAPGRRGRRSRRANASRVACWPGWRRPASTRGGAGRGQASGQATPRSNATPTWLVNLVGGGFQAVSTNYAPAPFLRARRPRGEEVVERKPRRRGAAPRAQVARLGTVPLPKRVRGTESPEGTIFPRENKLDDADGPLRGVLGARDPAALPVESLRCRQYPTWPFGGRRAPSGVADGSATFPRGASWRAPRPTRLRTAEVNAMADYRSLAPCGGGRVNEASQRTAGVA